MLSSAFHGQRGALSVGIFAIFFIEFVNMGGKDYRIFVRNIEVVHVPYDGDFFAIHHFIGDTPVVGVYFESPFNKGFAQVLPEK